MFVFDLPFYAKLYYHPLIFHLLFSNIMYLNNSQNFILSLKYSDLGSKNLYVPWNWSGILANNDII